MTWWAGEVESDAVDLGGGNVSKGVGDRRVWKVALNKGAADRAPISGRFVCGLYPKELKRERRSFHSREIGSESKVGWTFVASVGRGGAC